MKKLISIVLTITLFVIQMPCVRAAVNSKIYIDNVDYRISRTDSVLAPVKLSALPVTAQNGAQGSYGGGVIFVTFDKTKLEYVGTKTGTMESSKGNAVVWQSNDRAAANQNGEIRLAFADDTADRSKSYGEGSFVLNSNDTVLYLEFVIKQRASDDKIPVNITRAELAGNTISGTVMPSLIGGSTLDMAGGSIYISAYTYVSGFELEVYGDKNGVPYTEKYPFIVDGSAANKFYTVASPNKDGIVKAKVIPNFHELGYSLVITCADARVKINGDDIEIPAESALKQADLSIKVKRPDATIDTSGEYTLTVVRGNVTADVVKENLNTEVDANDLKGAIDTKADSLAGISTEIKLVIKQNTATAEDIEKIKEQAGADAAIFYFDASLFVTKKNTDGTVLSQDERRETAINPVTIRLEIPENMRGGSNYKVVRLHDGIAQIISATQEGNFLVFKTDKFSQYAISYATSIISTPTPRPGSWQGSNATPTPAPTQTPAAKHPAYIQGYPDNTFRSEAGITRAETVTIVSRLTGGFAEGTAYANNFTDVPKAAWYANYIGFIEAKQIIVGYSDGSFKPENGITRAEFAAVIARLKGLDTDTVKSLPFSDTAGHWAEKYLAAIYEKGYITGYPDKTFKPDANITRAEAVKIINAAMGRVPDKNTINANLAKYPAPFTDVSNAHWAYYDILEAAVSHDAADFHE
ncbi:MAG: Cellulosome-anchoring protein precursor [Firmicutes bacterium ADurb.Bin193]|nr:MAG: Cellulosome-anchoring protein precursor [Firmicutes bacterium ADurb.Bin193]